MTAAIFHDDLVLNYIICDNVCGGRGEWSITKIHPAAEKKGMSLCNLLKDTDPNIQNHDCAVIQEVWWSLIFLAALLPLWCKHRSDFFHSSARGTESGVKMGIFFGVYHILCGTEAPTCGSIPTRLIQGTNRTEIEKKTTLLWSLDEIFWLK